MIRKYSDNKRKTNVKESLVYCLDDLNNVFSDLLLLDITEWYEEGFSLEEIAEELERDPDEIFIALFHQARKGGTEKAFGKRYE